MFWGCLNRSGKTNTKNGRTSKHSECRYAKKCQTFPWKCQISSGNTRNMLVNLCSYLRRSGIYNFRTLEYLNESTLEFNYKPF